MQLPFAEAMRVHSLCLFLLHTRRSAKKHLLAQTSSPNRRSKPSFSDFLFHLVRQMQTLFTERMRITRVIIFLPSRITPRRSSRLPFEDRSWLLEYTSWSCLMSRYP